VKKSFAKNVLTAGWQKVLRAPCAKLILRMQKLLGRSTTTWKVALSIAKKMVATELSGILIQLSILQTTRFHPTSACLIAVTRITLEDTMG
jgi:hypothetical protein